MITRRQFTQALATSPFVPAAPRTFKAPPYFLGEKYDILDLPLFLKKGWFGNTPHDSHQSWIWGSPEGIDSQRPLTLFSATLNRGVGWTTYLWSTEGVGQCSSLTAAELLQRATVILYDPDRAEDVPSMYLLWESEPLYSDQGSPSPVSSQCKKLGHGRKSS